MGSAIGGGGGGGGSGCEISGGGGDNRGNTTSNFLNHQERINIIYLYWIHKLSVKEIAKQVNRSYSSILSIIQAYISMGHTNKLCNFQQKKSLLIKRGFTVRDDGSVSRNDALGYAPPSSTHRYGFDLYLQSDGTN